VGLGVRGIRGNNRLRTGGRKGWGAPHAAKNRKRVKSQRAQYTSGRKCEGVLGREVQGSTALTEKGGEVGNEKYRRNGERGKGRIENRNQGGMEVSERGKRGKIGLLRVWF